MSNHFEIEATIDGEKYIIRAVIKAEMSKANTATKMRCSARLEKILTEACEREARRATCWIDPHDPTP